MGLAVVCALVLAGTAVADSVTLTGAGPANQGGVYVYPYTLNIDGTTFAAICDDYSHEVYVGESWTANIYSFSQYQSGRFGSEGLQNYEEAAWLLSQIPSAGASEVGDINFAVWSIFTSGVPVQPKTGTLDGSAYWLTQAMTAANNNFYGMNFSNYRDRHSDGQRNRFSPGIPDRHSTRALELADAGNWTDRDCWSGEKETGSLVPSFLWPKAASTKRRLFFCYQMPLSLPVTRYAIAAADASGGKSESRNVAATSPRSAAVVT